MALPIRTFSNTSGGWSLFKALGHPLAAEAGNELLQKIRTANRAVVYDPLEQLATFAALYDLQPDDFDRLFVRDTLLLSGTTLSHQRLPVTDLADSGADLLFVVAFDSDGLLKQIEHLVPEGCECISLDAMRIPDRLLTRPKYLDPLNFVTNFAFFRDGQGRYTRLVGSNYWSSYGAEKPFLWCRLFSESGQTLLDFEVPLGKAGQALVIDSREIRAEHGLPEFCGQLFVSVVGGAGHDVVKYVLDVGGEDGDTSCTHDANAWPSDRYAGLPAPATDEQVVLWVQNSHCRPIPAGEIGLNLMGDDRVEWLDEPLPPFASRALDVRELLPEARWPQQVEIRAGKWFVRPRYEVIADGRRRINHPNVEREDLADDTSIRELASWLGKGFILPAPLLPPAQYSSQCLPTPMSTAQNALPLAARAYDPEGRELASHRWGSLPRRHDALLDMAEWAKGLPESGGHVELVYDLDQPGCTDGWLHALFRYTDLESGHGADTSFGAHLFNHLLTFRSEPQSYKGPPPGLTTRLFLRLVPPPTRVFCQLIYPVCERWHAFSSTVLQLFDAIGEPVAQAELRIPASGSRLFFVDEVFAADDLARAGTNGHIIVRDASCRLFGYHGVRHNSGFALDHMFGF